MSNLIENLYSTHEKMPKEFVPWDKFTTNKYRKIKWEDHLFWLGESSWWDDCCGRQICDSSTWPYTETSIISKYLKSCKLAAGEIKPYIKNFSMLTREPPVYIAEDIEGYLWYLDLVAAYWQIYTRTTLDVMYAGEIPTRGTVEFLDKETLKSYKLLRNCLVGRVIKTRKLGLDHGTLFWEWEDKNNLYPDLWGLIQDVLHFISHVMIENAGCVYVNTDGYIFKNKKDLEKGIKILNEFGLEWKIKVEGEGKIHGINNFSIGNFETADKNYLKIKKIENINFSLDKWLRVA